MILHFRTRNSTILYTLICKASFSLASYFFLTLILTSFFFATLFFFHAFTLLWLCFKDWPNTTIVMLLFIRKRGNKPPSILGTIPKLRQHILGLFLTHPLFQNRYSQRHQNYSFLLAVQHWRCLLTLCMYVGTIPISQYWTLDTFWTQPPSPFAYVI